MDDQTLNSMEVFGRNVLLVKIADHQSLEAASGLLVSVVEKRKMVTNFFAPMVKKAHEAHKEALARRKEVEEPLAKAEKYLRTGITDYLQEQEILRKVAEINAKKMVEEAAKKSTEGMLHQEDVDAFVESIPPPAIPEVETPEGITTRDNLCIEVVSIKHVAQAVANGEVSEDIISVNESEIRDLVRRYGADNVRVPGVKVGYQKGVVVKGR